MNFIRRLFPAPGGEKLARRLMAELRRTGVEGEMSYDPEKGIIEVSEPSIQVNLANLHLDLALNLPWRRGAIIRRFAAGLSDGTMDRPKTLGEVRDRLLPNLRDAATWDFLRLDAALQGLEGMEIPRQAVTPRLSAALYIDADNGMSMVTADDLERWGVGFDEGMHIGIENLAARSQEPFEKVADGVWASPWGDCYDTARLLLPDKLREVEVNGDLVAFCPHWSALFLTGANDEAGLGACLNAAAQQITEAPKPMSAQPIVRRYPGWEALRFARGHALYDLWAKARVYEMIGVYHDQQSSLEEWTERQGDDVYVAQFNAMENKQTKRVRSYCVWSKGVPTLLPETDEVMFYEDDKPEDEKVTQVDWDVMWAHCNGLLQLTEHVPARWRVEAFPDSETCHRMSEAQARRGPT